MTTRRADPDETSARRAAGRAVRELGHALVGRHADARLLDDVASTVTELTDRLRDGDERSRRIEDFAWDGEGPAHDSPVESYDDRPFSGGSSPWGLDLDVHRRGDEIEAHVTLGPAHEGAPGRCHGGIVAGLFDDVFGFILGVIRQPAFTGELTVRYVAPTPLHRPLVCRGRLAERRGRKIVIEGELVDRNEQEEQVVARGRGMFIAVDPAMFARTIALPAPDEPDPA